MPNRTFMVAGRRGSISSTIVLLLWVIAAPAPNAGASFVNFESGQVRPLALSPDGGLLFAVNTPDNRLAIFTVTPTGLELANEVPVGLEPVAVAVRSDGTGALEAWVVNHLSDSVSIVRVHGGDPSQASVVGTLLVGDEPRDVVFGGTSFDRAFITTARRGQNVPAAVDPLLTTEGVPRALVWVFNAGDPFADTDFDAGAASSPLGGEPLAILELFGDSPRALAVSPDGSRVYAAIFLSGNQTSTVNSSNVEQNGGLPPPPPDSPYYPDQFPQTALVVRFDPASGEWRDELWRDWGVHMRLSLPDADVFAIDAEATPPALLPTMTASGVGTVLYGMAVRPGTGTVFVSNTEARNEVRFEPLIDATHGVQGRFVDNRITVITPSGPLAVGLNPHADHSQPTGPPEERAESLSQPSSLAFSADGRLLYVAAFGSEAVGIFAADDLEAGLVTRALVPVGGGPSGLVLDDARQRLYVLNRFDQTISVIDGAGDASTAAVSATVLVGFDPSTPDVKHGRRFLFDARFSGHGDVSCGSCHVFADFDGLAWDLGNPYGLVLPNANKNDVPPWHPMKGPMTTQSLRGLVDAGPMHWRGDRTAATEGGNPFDTDGAFKTFNPAFVGLMGSERELSAEEMQSFTDWVLTIRYPPNPVAQLDGNPTAAEALGAEFFQQRQCPSCHALPLGTSRRTVSLFGSEGFKIPHLRNVYAKVGMFGQQDIGPFLMPYLGDQTRGFGFFHDGASMLELPEVLFGDPAEAHNIPLLREFLLAFSTGLAPVVGQQLSATPASVADAATLARRDLLVSRAEAGDCDLVVHGMIDGETRGALYLGGGDFETDRAAAPETLAALWSRAGTAGAEQVWTCVPPGSGRRMGIDRDEDGYSDRDELDANTSPVDPVSHPGGPVVIPVATKSLRMSGAVGRASRRLRFKSVPGEAAVAPPAPGSAGDPTAAGATVRVYNGAGSGEQQTFALPASQWRVLRNGYYFRSRGTGITAVRVKAGRIAIKGRGPAFGYTLDEPAQRRIVVRLTLGNAVDWCAEAIPAGDRAVDRPGAFKVRDVAAPSECQAPPAG